MNASIRNVCGVVMECHILSCHKLFKVPGWAKPRIGDMTQDGRHQLLCGLWFSGKKRQHQQEEKKAEGCSKHEPTESDGGRLMLTGRIPIGPGDEKLQALGPLCVCVAAGRPNQARHCRPCRARDLINWLLAFGFLGDEEERESQGVSTCQGFEISRDNFHHPKLKPTSQCMNK
jgi:hypothetical protein